MTVLVVALLCMMVAGYMIANARTQFAHTVQAEQILHADLLAQDALEIAKQTLLADAGFRGVSTWYMRNDGSLQYRIQDHPDIPLPDTLKNLYPNGVMITGIGKETDGSVQKRVIWYDPVSHKTYVYMHG